MGKNFMSAGVSGELDDDGALLVHVEAPNFGMVFRVEPNVESLATLRIAAQNVPNIIEMVLRGMASDGQLDFAKAAEFMESLCAVCDADVQMIDEEEMNGHISEAVDEFLAQFQDQGEK